ncbi:MAG: hypothetical protein WCK58_18140, partial [Chloroflexota bacterium]
MRAGLLRRTMAATAASGLLLVTTTGAFTVSASSGTLVITASTTLTDDHVGNIVIEAGGVTLDCAGHTVSGPDAGGEAGGIVVASKSGVTIRNCVVAGFTAHGIYVIDSAGVRLER